ncbi:MAG: NADH-flavin reductase [Pseudomonas sp.]|uniref:NADH-flavin reductase n=1 Tax=Pseudomonas sp. TaxID=306 RepID=UPI0033962854
MRNLETAVRKFALYGVHCSLGSALLVELLNRQHETLAVLEDLNALSARPGLRTKLGSLQVADGHPREGLERGIVESVAGMHGVVCVLNSPALFGGALSASRLAAVQQPIEGLLQALPQAGVEHLLLIDHFDWLDQPEAQPLHTQLLDSPLPWTLVNALAVTEQFHLDDLRHPEGLAEDDPRRPLVTYANAVVDELESPCHLRQRLQLHC